MQEPRDSFSNEDEEAKWPGLNQNQNQQQQVAAAQHSRNSSRPLEHSGSLAQEEFGSAEAMEYTPSNTSQNNSIPTQLVTHSNSNLNLSQIKGGSSMMLAGGNQVSVSQSPSPYHYSQIDQHSQSRVNSFKEAKNAQSQHAVNNRLDFNQVSQIGGGAQILHQNGANSLMTQEPSIMTQSIPGLTNYLQPNQSSTNKSQQNQQHMMGVVEDDFFEHHASLLMQQQRSSATNKAITQQAPQSQQMHGTVGSSQQQQMTVQTLGPAQQIPTESSHNQQYMVSQSTTPGFLSSATAPPDAVQSSKEQHKSEQAAHEQIQVQNFSVNQQQAAPQYQSQQLQNPPLVQSQKRIVPHQTISLVPQQQQQQHQQVPHQLQQLQQQQLQTQQPTPSNYFSHQPSLAPPSMNTPVSTGQVDALNSDLMAKLQQKVQQQAQRLQAEAQYRLLCEKRIKKLDPQHPLPVQFEHLEKPAFQPAHVQQVYVNQSPNQLHQQEQNRQIVAHLQQRVSELTKQVADKQTLTQRLKQTEESLRNEVLQAEEQRAYIEMLKEQVDQKIKAVGLSFEAEPNNAANMSRSNDLSRNNIQPSGVRSNSNSRHSIASGNSAGQNSQLNRSRQSLSKSNSQQRQIDGLLQISTLQKAYDDMKSDNDALKGENDILKAKIEQNGFNLTSALSEQRDAFQQQIGQLQSQIQDQIQVKNQLDEKNETLLEYAKQNIDKNADQDAKIVEVERLRQNAESQMSQSQDKVQSLEQDLLAKETLLDQVKKNLEDIRAEKITTQAHLNTLQNEKEDLERSLEQSRAKSGEEVRNLESKLREQQSEVKSISDRLQNKEDLLKSTEKRLETAIQSEMQLKAQLNEELSRAQNVNTQNFTLKHTLVDSQQEMDTLVGKYDKAVEDLIQRDHRIEKLTNDLLQSNRDSEKVQDENEAMKQQLEKQNKELFDVYGSLRRKEEVLRNMEERLTRKIGEKEDHCMTLQSKISHLEQTFSKEASNMDQLRRICDERTQVGASLENTLKEKDMLIRDIKAEQVQLRHTHERAYQQREEELLQQIQQKGINQFNLTQESQKLQKTNEELEQQTSSAQTIIKQLQSQQQDLQNELERKEQQRQRWEDEVKRLESAQNCAIVQHEDLQRDYERIRQQQIDDAVLIDRMRIAQGEMKDQVNQIVGRISKFGYHLEEIGQMNLPEDIESAYEISKKICPVTHDVNSALEYISNFIRPLSNDIVTRLQNVPERDSDRSLTMNRSGIQNTDRQSSSNANLEQQSLVKSQKEQSNIQSQAQSIVNQIADYNPHDFNSRNNQQQASNFTLMSQQNQKPLSVQGNATCADYPSIADSSAQQPNVHFSQDQPSLEQQPLAAYQQALAKTSVSVVAPSNIEASMDRQSGRSDHPEILALKNQIVSLEQTSLLDQEEKEDLEQALKIVLQITTLGNTFKLLLQGLHLRIRDTNQTRREKYTVSTKLLQMEQRYHYESKLAMTQSIQVELTLLKQGIVRERSRLHELETTLEANMAEQKQIVGDILRSNSFATDQTTEMAEKIQKSNEMYEEANLQRKEIQEQLEWTQALLQEQRSLRGRFAPREPSGENKRSREPSAEPSRPTSGPRAAPARDVSGDSRKDQAVAASERKDPTSLAFKNYYMPQSFNKTEMELKSEEFNRKQIINSSRAESFDNQDKTRFGGSGQQFRVYTAAEGTSDYKNQHMAPQREKSNQKTRLDEIREQASSSEVALNTLYRQETSHLRASMGKSAQSLLDSQPPTRGRDGSRGRDTSGHALRNRDNSGSLSRSKSPSQASDIIRRKYSQIRTLTYRPDQLNNQYGTIDSMGSMRDMIEPYRSERDNLTVAHLLNNTKPLRQSPPRAEINQIMNYAVDNSSQSQLLKESRSPGTRERDLLNEVSANQFKRF